MATPPCRACGTPMTVDQPSGESWDGRHSLCPACAAALLQPIPYCTDDLEDHDLAPSD